MNRVIKLIDNQCDRYSLEADHYVLGRQWDNEAEHIVVEKPSAEKDSVCEMFVKANGKLIEVIRVYDEPIPVRSILSQYAKVTIGFSFSRIDGYIKNSEFKDFYFLEAIKPEDFVPTEPEGKDRLNYLLNNALIDMRWKEGGNNTLELINADLKVIRELELSGFVQEQADLGETNPQSEKYVQNKSTKHLQNEGEDGTSPYVTEKTLEDTLENLSDAFGVPDKTSQLENDGDGTSPFVTLLNTYTREEVNALISAINSMKKEIVDTLPTENIDDSTIYLVPKTNGSGNDYYDEYLYINGNFEFIGSTQIDLSQYVKFTDFGSNTNPGVFMTRSNGGIFTNNGYLYIKNTTDADLADKANKTYIALTLGALDKGVKDGLVNSQIEWSEDEKQSATDLIGAVKQVPFNSTDGSLRGFVYIVDHTGKQTTKELRTTSNFDSIPLRNPRGNFYVNDPQLDLECANKRYVDNIVPQIELTLKENGAYTLTINKG